MRGVFGRLVFGDTVAKRREVNSGEHRFASSKQDRRKCEVQFVDQSGTKILAHRFDAAADLHITTLGGDLRLFQGRLDSVSHEEEGGATFHLDRIPRIVGQYEGRRVVGRILTPPTLPVFVRPGSTHRAEHVAAEDEGAEPIHGPARIIIIDAARAAALADHCLEEARADEPGVQVLPALAERIVETLVNSCSETVERNRKRSNTQFRHNAPSDCELLSVGRRVFHRRVPLPRRPTTPPSDTKVETINFRTSACSVCVCSSRVAVSKKRSITPSGTLMRKQARHPTPSGLRPISRPPRSWAKTDATPMTNRYTTSACALADAPSSAPKNREHLRREQCGGQALNEPRRDKNLSVGRESANGRRRRKEADARQERALSSKTVAQPASNDQRGSVCDGVAGDNELDLCLAGPEVPLHVGNGDVDDEEIEHRHERADEQHENRCRCTVWSVFRVRPSVSTSNGGCGHGACSVANSGRGSRQGGE